MYKKFTNSFCNPRGYIPELLLVMKLTTFLLVISFVQVSAVTFSQKMTLNESRATYERVFREIRRQTGYDILISSTHFSTKQRISVYFNNAPLEKVLDHLAKEANLSYLIDGKAIVLKEKPVVERRAPDEEKVQQLKVSGRVTDTTGAPLPGVAVQVKNTDRAVATDEAGYYSINVPDVNAVLVFSYLGYENKEVSVGNRTMVDVVLRIASEGLDEVVVIGYGTRSKRDVTGSIGQVSSKDLKDQPITSFDQGLAGRIPGVEISQSNGAPGGGLTINIRGISSISGGNQPLIVVDGVPLSSSLGDRFTQGQSSNGSFDAPYVLNPLSSINPNDIESVEVLKDAASAAIYGSRGSNGVILITTKKGRKGEKTRIDFSTYAGFQQVTKKVDVMNAQEFAEYSKLTRDLAWVFKDPANNSPDDPLEIRDAQTRYASYFLPYLNGESGLVDTDWQDEIFRNAPTQNYEVSASGGTEKTRYYISGNYFDQQGIVINSGLKRYSARLNFETELTDAFRFGINLNPSYSDYAMVQTEKNHGKEGLIILALMYHPNLPVRNPDGSLALGELIMTQRSGESNVATIENPVALAEWVDNSLDHSRFLGNTFLEADLLEGLKFRTSLGLDINYMDRFFYRPKTLNANNEVAPTTTKNYAWSNTSSTFNILSENTLVYDRYIGDHAFNALLGYTAQKETNRRQYLEGRNFPNDNVTSLNAASSTNGYSEERQWSLLSFIGRLSYSYQDKYLFMTSIRRDGSSRFGRNNKWGWFPSVSGGWRISSEPFFQDVAAINDLKLRASYGVTGNTDIPYYGGTALLGEADYILGDNTQNGLAPSTSPNANLSWETTKTIDIGLDISLLKNKLNITADYYRSNTEDLLLNVTVPGSSGFSSSLRNIGEVENKGYEIMVSTEQNIGRQLSWSGSANFSVNRGKVISLGPGQEQFLTAGGLSEPSFIVRIGEPIGSYYGYQVNGVFRSQEQFDSTPHLEGANQGVGDFIYADSNGDGKVDENDRVVLGSYNPDFTWGFNSSFGYKGFDLSFNIQGKHGLELFNAMHRYLAETWGNNHAVYLSENAPRPVWGVGTQSHTRPSSWHVEDGSFIRVRNITFGYSLPASLLGKMSLSAARIYFSSVNPFTWTDYSGYNPEVSSNFGDATTGGEEFGNYPVAKSFILGLNVSF